MMMDQSEEWISDDAVADGSGLNSEVSFETLQVIGHGSERISRSSKEVGDSAHGSDEGSLSSFNLIPDDILVNILCRLFDDPRHLACLACVCARFYKVIRTVSWKSRCEQTLPFLVSELVHPPLAEPPGGWASLQKLVVCCPGLWHAGVLLESWDFGLDRELAWFDELNSCSHSGIGETSLDTEFYSQGYGRPGYCVTEEEDVVQDVNGCGILPHNRFFNYVITNGDMCNKDQIILPGPSPEVPEECDYWGQHLITEYHGNLFKAVKSRESLVNDLTDAKQMCNSQFSTAGSSMDDFRPDHFSSSSLLAGALENSYHVVPSDALSRDKRKGVQWERDEKRRKRQQHGSCHMATGSSPLSREQGNKLLANRFRTDCLYISDWPGCVHPGEKRKYKLFRGVFKNFKNSHVWRNLKDMHAKATNVGCAFCCCKTTWDMVTNFCLKRSIEYHDDGEPFVRAYVCENGHVSGAWTDRPMYS